MNEREKTNRNTSELLANVLIALNLCWIVKETVFMKKIS